MPTQKDPNVITLTNVRLSYPQLWEAKEAPGGGKPKFSATFLLDCKKHKEEIALLERTIERVALDMFKKKVHLKHKCLRDGAEKDSDGYGEGTMFVPSSSQTRPVVVGRDRSPLAEADGIIYAGCYVNAVVRIFAYDHATGGKGVSAGLQAIQFVKDGESFGAGRVNADEVFDAIGDDTDDF